MGKGIVIAVDSSSPSKYALSWTLKNMYMDGDTLHLVHCFKPLQPAVGPHYAYVPTEAEQENWRKEQAAILEEFAAEAAKTREGVQVKAHLVAGDPRDELMACADSWDAAAIVLGCRGHGAIKRALLGSVSTYISHHSQRPVVIIHGEH